MPLLQLVGGLLAVRMARTTEGYDMAKLEITEMGVYRALKFNLC